MCLERRSQSRGARVAILASVLLSGSHAALDEGMLRRAFTVAGLVALIVALIFLCVDGRVGRNTAGQGRA